MHENGFLKLVQDAMPHITEITCDQVQKMRDGHGAIIVDVREDSEWQNGHVKDAIHLGRGIIERDIETTIPKKDTTIILYCGGGYRSALSAQSIQKMGYSKVYSLQGGWKAWKQAALPTED